MNLGSLRWGCLMQGNRRKTGDFCTNAFTMGEELPPDGKLMFCIFREKSIFIRRIHLSGAMLGARDRAAAALPP